MHLVEAGPTRVLLDCGLVRGPREDSRPRNRDFPFDPSTLTAVVLSHAHTDHCGNLPNLVRQGFSGPIYCTPATRDLLAIVLGDSARIHAEEARMQGVVAGHHSPVRTALFTPPDVERTLAQVVALPYGEPVVFDDVEVRFLDAGHILGSAVVTLRLQHGVRERRITFTGDLGRRGLPFLREPPAVPAADLVISESTYGGRTHDSVDRMAEKLSDVMRRTVARSGKVLMPAFSLGRTQVVVHYLRKWMQEGVLPRLPVYIDSPLAEHIAEVYEDHHGAAPDPDNTLPEAGYLHGHEETRERTTQAEPCVIVASGGMCDGGRIVQHLRHHIDDPRSSLVLVTYQAPHSVGARLLERRPTVRFHGRNWNKWIEVVEINGFSGHADQEDFGVLLAPAAGETRRVRLVHGEPEQAEALAARLRRQGFADVAVPRREETVPVG
jgi:metallo-beta-lactamase family protein